MRVTGIFASHIDFLGYDGPWRIIGISSGSVASIGSLKSLARGLEEADVGADTAAEESCSRRDVQACSGDHSAEIDRT
jgi:hypothetical protein